MKTTLAILITLCGLSTAMQAQVAASATTGASALHYSLRYSQLVQKTGTYGISSTAMASGDAGYGNASKRLPFGLNFSGGYNFALTGSGSNGGGFENLSLSQGIVWRKSSLHFSDNVSYRHQAPTTGFSGVAGTGENGIPVGTTSETILTVNTSSVNNNSTGQFSHRVNRSVSVNAGGGYQILAYPSGQGEDTNTTSANGGGSWRLNARSSLTASYAFMNYSYSKSAVTIDSQSTPIGYERNWTRQLHTNISAGPQWISSSSPSTNTLNGVTLPNSLSYSINANIDDTLRSGNASLAYQHGVSGGSGYLLGSEVDSIDANFMHGFRGRRAASIGAQAGYRRTAGLTKNGATDSVFCTAVASRRLGRDFSAFGSYSISHQSTSSILPSNALTGISQTISVGMEFSPRRPH